MIKKTQLNHLPFQATIIGCLPALLVLIVPLEIASADCYQEVVRSDTWGYGTGRTNMEATMEARKDAVQRCRTTEAEDPCRQFGDECFMDDINIILAPGSQLNERNETDGNGENKNQLPAYEAYLEGLCEYFCQAPHESFKRSMWWTD